MGRGGQRAGAGRPKKEELYEKPIAAAEKKFADKLPALAANVLKLATIGSLSVSEVWEPAGLVTVDGTETIETEKGAFSVKTKNLAFPNKKPEELVLVKRTITQGGPNLAALMYAINRIMGTPTERQEISGPDGGAIPFDVEGAISKVYGEDPPEAPPGAEDSPGAE